MSADLWILVATAVVAAIAIIAAVIAVRASRRVPEPIPRSRLTVHPRSLEEVQAVEEMPASTAVTHVIEGRVIVPPTQQQLVQTMASRPGVRLSILAHGVAHALRSESRDRITGLMRREYRRRRRERMQAGRHAARAAQPRAAQPSGPADQWLGS